MSYIYNVSTGHRLEQILQSSLNLLDQNLFFWKQIFNAILIRLDGSVVSSMSVCGFHIGSGDRQKSLKTSVAVAFIVSISDK